MRRRQNRIRVPRRFADRRPGRSKSAGRAFAWTSAAIQGSSCRGSAPYRSSAATTWPACAATQQMPEINKCQAARRTINPPALRRTIATRPQAIHHYCCSHRTRSLPRSHSRPCQAHETQGTSARCHAYEKQHSNDEGPRPTLPPRIGLRKTPRHLEILIEGLTGCLRRRSDGWSGGRLVLRARTYKWLVVRALIGPSCPGATMTPECACRFAHDRNSRHTKD